MTDDPHGKAWYDSLAIRSRVTADMYAGGLARLLEAVGLGAEEAVAEASADPDSFADQLVQYAAAAKKHGRLDSTVKKSFGPLKSYLDYRHVQFRAWPKLKPIAGASLEKERVPRPEELGTLLEHLSLRGRVAALMMAHGGVRPAVLGTYGATAGLTLDALAELDLGPLTFSAVPFVIRVPAHLSKTSVSYTTFGTEELGRSICAYLAERRNEGEKLTRGSPLVAHSSDVRGIAAKSLSITRSAFMTTGAIMGLIREALEKCTPDGVTWRPYVLRSYCSTRLMLAEGSGHISRDLREAILGHNGGVASRYNVGKRWGQELLDEARREYARASSFLETNQRAEKPDVLSEAKALILEADGANPAEAARLADRPKEEVLAEFRRRLGAGEPTSAGAASPGGGPATGTEIGKSTDRIVAVAEAERLLGAGWVFLGSVGDRVAVRAPGGGSWDT